MLTQTEVISIYEKRPDRRDGRVNQQITILRMCDLKMSLFRGLFVSAQVNQLIHLIHLKKQFVSLFWVESVDFFSTCS